MIQLKLKVRRFRKPEVFNLPTNYGEVPVWKLPLLAHKAEHQPDELGSFLMDCPHVIPAAMLLPYLGWMQQPVDLTKYEASDDQSIPDIREETWGQKINAHMELQKNTVLESLPVIVSIYMKDKTAEEWGKETLDVLYPIAFNIIKQLRGVLELEANRLKSSVTQEEVMAGIYAFNELGYMNTIDVIAGGKVWRYEDVLAIDYNTIFAKLLKMNISNKFETRYREVLKLKNSRK
jgi:hypothetical protein